tara:strand:+ start:783 stop:1004 length:222 start_codon:yes stop_codon:yes gene_type:complete
MDDKDALDFSEQLRNKTVTTWCGGHIKPKAYVNISKEIPNMSENDIKKMFDENPDFKKWWRVWSLLEEIHSGD